MPAGDRIETGATILLSPGMTSDPWVYTDAPYVDQADEANMIATPPAITPTRPATTNIMSHCKPGKTIVRHSSTRTTNGDKSADTNRLLHGRSRAPIYGSPAHICSNTDIAKIVT